MIVLDCFCGNPAEVWYVKDWAMVGCETCGITAGAYKNLEQATIDWNNIQKIDGKTNDQSTR